MHGSENGDYGAILVPILVILTATVPGAGAAVPVWDDPAGDTRWDTGTAAASGSEQVDLRFLEVDEQPEGFWVWVGLDRLASSLDILETIETRIEMALDADGQAYHLSLGKGSGTVTYYDATLTRVKDGAEEFVWASDTFLEESVQVDHERQAIGAFLDRRLVTDPMGQRLARGSSFSIGQVTSSAPALGCVDFATCQGRALQTTDAMPDDAALASLQVVHGDVRAGVAVQSLDPFRTSNGEATTFVFPVDVSAVHRTTVRVEAMGPPTWTVDVPTPAFELAEGGNRTIPILVTTPFGHAHGGIETVQVRIISLDDPAVYAETLVGIRYLPVPQPAGHHDTLFLHSRQVATGLSHSLEEVTPQSTRTPLTMNALEDEDGDTHEGVDARPGLSEPGGATFAWFAELSPSLGIGLDFDMTRTGTVHVPLQIRQPVQDARLDVRVVLRGAGGEPGPSGDPYFGEPILELATGSAFLGSLATGDAAAEAGLSPLPEADHLPYVDGSQLFLEITLVSGAPAAPAPFTPIMPALSPGGWVELPLREYAEQVPSQLVGVEGVPLVTEDPVREANPGDTLVWHIDAADGLELDLVGARTGDARLVGDYVVLVVPATAGDGDLIEFFVVGRSREDVGVLKLAVHVDTQGEHADQADLAAGLGRNESPSAPWILGIVAVAWGVSWRRRREQ